MTILTYADSACMHNVYMQFNWHDYGVDWEGPVPCNDDNTVEVPEDPDILSASQKLELKELLSQVEMNRFSREEMVSQMAIAKSFVHMYTYMLTLAD